MFSDSLMISFVEKYQKLDDEINYAIASAAHLNKKLN